MEPLTCKHLVGVYLYWLFGAGYPTEKSWIGDGAFCLLVVWRSVWGLNYTGTNRLYGSGCPMTFYCGFLHWMQCDYTIDGWYWYRSSSVCGSVGSENMHPSCCPFSFWVKLYCSNHQLPQPAFQSHPSRRNLVVLYYSYPLALWNRMHGVDIW